METETLKALKGSIAKWEAIVARRIEDGGPLDCPLCQRFRYSSGEKVKCNGCPVRERTGLNGCHGTPYYAYEEADSEGELDEETMKGLAQDELDFLKSLLPASSE